MRHGSFLDETIYDRNAYVLEGETARILLKDKHLNVVAEAIIDAEDISKCKEFKWYARKSRTKLYVAGTINGKKVFLHRFILGYDGELDVDHINMNPLDNRKSNLRIIPHSANIANNKSTGVKKVPSGRYQASICYKGKTMYLGTFDDEESARTYRQQIKQKLFGL